MSGEGRAGENWGGGHAKKWLEGNVKYFNKTLSGMFFFNYKKFL